MIKRSFTMILTTITLAVCLSGCSKDKPQTSNSLDDKNSPSIIESQMQSSSDDVEKGEDMPYVDPSYKYDASIEREKVDPWVSTPYFLDSVKQLTIEDLTGEVTFLGGSIYSFISKEGIHDQPADMAVGENAPETAELYMANTDVVRELNEGDVITLAAINMHQTGAIQKIIKIHKTNGDFVHFTTQFPSTEELFDREGMSKAMEEYNKNSQNTITSDEAESEWPIIDGRSE